MCNQCFRTALCFEIDKTFLFISLKVLSIFQCTIWIVSNPWAVSLTAYLLYHTVFDLSIPFLNFFEKFLIILSKNLIWHRSLSTA